MNGLETVQALVRQGYSPVQAAALAGHMEQESGFDPSNINPKEGAHGLLQWEGPRWDALQSFAKSRGQSPSDPDVQIAFIGQEMNGPEAKSSAAFRSATDVGSAADALKSYVRFGDDSANTRRKNAMDLYSQYTGGPVGALGDPTDPTNPTQMMPAVPTDPTNPIDPTQSIGGAAPLSLTAPGQVGALAPANPMAAALKSLGSSMAPPQAAAPAVNPAASPYLAPQQIQMAHPSSQSAQIALALAKAYGLGGMG